MLLILTVIISGCSGEQTPDAVHKPLPDYLRVSTQVEDMYLAAANHAQVLEYMPCYCGCEDVGHTSNYDCFVRQAGADGTVTEWDPMGAG
ncbi:MAG: hypothetical protein H0Z33_02785 [Bacillaceae bacterium]|nr:hypothetical protein [Bacillaceae bacterium]